MCFIARSNPFRTVRKYNLGTSVAPADHLFLKPYVCIVAVISPVTHRACHSQSSHRLNSRAPFLDYAHRWLVITTYISHRLASHFSARFNSRLGRPSFQSSSSIHPSALAHPLSAHQSRRTPITTLFMRTLIDRVARAARFLFPMSVFADGAHMYTHKNRSSTPYIRDWRVHDLCEYACGARAK